jgi:hypothetical protein
MIGKYLPNQPFLMNLRFLEVFSPMVYKALQILPVVLLLFLLLPIDSHALDNSDNQKNFVSSRRGQKMFTNTMQSDSIQAVRLIFEYEGDQVRLVSQQQVDIAVTGIDMTQESQPGYYVDTRSAANQTLARVSVHNAFNTSMEVFPERHDEPITRVDMAVPQGAFTVVVPATDRASHVTLTRITLSEHAAPGVLTPNLIPAAPEVNDLASFPLVSH